MKIKACLWCLLWGAPVMAQSVAEVSKVWVADNGDGTYKNPVIYADYSDPDAIRVGDDYYLVASSFDAVPGLPILHSKDLVNWRITAFNGSGRRILLRAGLSLLPPKAAYACLPRSSRTAPVIYGRFPMYYSRNFQHRRLALR
jgi:hypothetical protein